MEWENIIYQNYNKFCNCFFCISCFFFYYRIVGKLNIKDKPNHRSSHSRDTIRGGGILFFLALLFFYFLQDLQYPYFVVASALIYIISFVDYRKGLSSKIRLPFQFIAIFSMYYQLGISFSPVWLLPLLMIVGVLFINVYNFMDGINGITGLYSISV